MSFAMTFSGEAYGQQSGAVFVAGRSGGEFYGERKVEGKLVANRWHHVALVVGEDTVAFYLDGFVDIGV